MLMMSGENGAVGRRWKERGEEKKTEKYEAVEGKKTNELDKNTPHTTFSVALG